MSSSDEGLISRRRRMVRDYVLAHLGLKDNPVMKFEAEFDVVNMQRHLLHTSLIELLEDDDDINIKSMSAYLLMETESTDPRVIDFVDRCLSCDDSQLRLNMACMLLPIRVLPEKLIVPLHGLLSQTNWFSKFIASMVLLGRCGESEQLDQIVNVLVTALRGDALPLLREALKVFLANYPKADRAAEDAHFRACNYVVRQFAALALARAGLRREEAIPVVLQGIETGTAQFQLYYLKMCWLLEDWSAEAIPVLTRVLAKPETSNEVKRAVGELLSRFGELDGVSRALVDPLRDFLRSRNWSSAIKIAMSIASMGEPATYAVEVLIRRLANKDEKARETAAICLGILKKPHDAIIPALIKRARVESSREVWLRIAQALVAIGDPVVLPLLDSVRRQDILLTPLAHEVFMNLDDATKDRLICLLLESGVPHMRHTAAAMLTISRLPSPSCIPIAIDLLRNGDDDTRLDAVIALSGCKTISPEVAQALVSVLSDSCTDVALGASNALKTMGVEAIIALEAALPDSNASTKEKIQSLLERLGHASLSRRKGPDFSWVGDDRLLEFFVQAARILEAGPLGIRSIAKTLQEKKSNNLINPAIPSNESTVGLWINRLEEAFSRHEKRPIRLIDRDPTRRRKGGLTEFGLQLLPQIIQYLDLES